MKPDSGTKKAIKKRPIKPSTEPTPKKEAMLKALEITHGIVTKAAIKAGIDRGTHYDWMKSDEKYRASVIDIDESQLDYTEDMLYTLIGEGNVTAVLFHLKCKGKKRGYSETAKIEDESKPQTAGFDWKPL